jgi:hypothetical protein
MNMWLLNVLVDVFVICMIVTMALLTTKKALEWVADINHLLRNIRKQG